MLRESDRGLASIRLSANPAAEPLPAALKVADPKRPPRMVGVPDYGSLVARVGSDGNVLADKTTEYRSHLLNRIRGAFMQSDPLGIHRPRVDDPEVVWLGELSLRPGDERLVDDAP